jgi:hypothetical protein
MTKAEYIESFEEIVNDELFLTSDVELLDKEILNNCWSISLSQEIANQLTEEELLILLKRIKANRLEQLNKSDLKIDLIFYTWFDEQASQLRFNLINSNHKKLPFGAGVSFVKFENEIIQDFLNSNYHDGFPLDEFEVIYDGSEDDVSKIDDFSEVNDLEYLVKVYKEVLKKE